MKRNAGKILSAAKASAVLILFLLCIFYPQLTGKAVSEALQRCLVTVIPSLYAMMIVSAVIVRSGILTYTPKAMERLSGAVFGMDGFTMAVFSFSAFSGYPVGTSMIIERYEKKAISRETASVLSGLCCGAGPAFVFGCISGKYYSTHAAGIIITLSAVSANLLLALMLSPFLKKSGSAQYTEKKGLSLTSETLTESIISSGKSMAVICFTITAFAVLSEFLDASGIYGKAGGILSRLSGLPEKNAVSLLRGITDITAAGPLPRDDYTLLPFLCAMTSFGGICVLFQLCTLIRGRFPVMPLILIRTASAILSGVICRVTVPFFLRRQLIAVSVINVRLYSPPSPVPSVMLIIMTFMLFLSFKRERR